MPCIGMFLIHVSVSSLHKLRRLMWISAHVHISNLAAQTGASLFLQVHSPPYLTPTPVTSSDVSSLSLSSISTFVVSLSESLLGSNSSVTPEPSLSSPPLAHKSWTYTKTENQSFQDLTANKAITHLISEAPLSAILRTPKVNARLAKSWKEVHAVRAFDKWSFDRAAVKRVWSNLVEQAQSTYQGRQATCIQEGGCVRPDLRMSECSGVGLSLWEQAKGVVKFETKEVLWIYERQ